MATIYTPCPNTGRAVSTGIEIDADSFTAIPDVIARVHCPHCGEQHNWSKYNAFLRDAALTCATKHDDDALRREDEE